MVRLSDAQQQQFTRDGIVVVENAISREQLQALRQQFAAWVQESRGHDRAYGEIADGRPRFDLEPGHSSQAPGLRRVNAPSEVSKAYFEVMSNSTVTDMAAGLIGPDVRHHHNKINSKLPGTGTKVGWHQDFAYTPHSNTDLVTALLFLDDVTDDNGPLEVLPGSHKGPLYSLWHDGVFTGAVDEETAEACRAGAERCTGPAGSVCFMHTCVLHGSAPNHSEQPRTLFITVYAAADAAACAPNPVPSRHGGLMVRGSDPQRIRAMAYNIELPEYPGGASFFAQQSTRERAGG